jgi:deazaflavin-dependent oxidoreductase (nitroreductase family)
VGNGLDGDTFWLVAAHGTQADYVRNLQAEPRVRVKAGGAWRSGTAVVLRGDDPAARSRTLPYQWDAAIGRMMASAPLTIRIDLDPAPEPKRGHGRSCRPASSTTRPCRYGGTPGSWDYPRNGRR